jgi:hypothetical protein
VKERIGERESMEGKWVRRSLAEMWRRQRLREEERIARIVKRGREGSEEGQKRWEAWCRRGKTEEREKLGNVSF